VTLREVESLVRRDAVPSDAQPLTALIRRAKAHWGYPKEWLDAWRSELVITPDYIRQQRVVLLTERGEIAGFFGLESRGPVAHLEHLWVEPAGIRRGIGRKLLTMACADARDQGYRIIELVADPNAESFYLHHGAIRVGEVHTEVRGTPRALPRMQLDIEQVLRRSRASTR
jgi:ribosomal protein S18 acetylase RimI-like enzyme